MAFEEVSWEESITSQLSKYKAKGDEVSVIHVIEKYSKGLAKVHSSFDHKIQKFHCLSTGDSEKLCCQVLGRPTPRFCLVVAQLQTRSNGKLLSEPIDPGKVYFWDIPLGKRNQIFKAKGEESLGDIDLKITCKTEKTQELDIEKHGDTVFYDKKYADDREEALEAAAEIFASMEKMAFYNFNEEKIRSIFIEKGLLEGEVSGGFKADEEEEASPVKETVSTPTKSATPSEGNSSDLEAFLDN